MQILHVQILERLSNCTHFACSMETLKSWYGSTEESERNQPELTINFPVGTINNMDRDFKQLDLA